jgi:hypothetical protein
MSALKPDVDSTHDLGTTALRWRKLWVDEIAATDAIAIGGNLTVTGNLQVDGATTTINSTTLTVDDKNIVVASGAAAAANWTGSGITVDGANATLLYTDDGAGTTQWEFSDDLELTGKLLPVANATHDLGSSSLGWNDLYLGDGGILQLGDDQDVTLTHIADTGVRLNDSMKLEFRDATEFLHSDADGSMTLEGGSTVKLSINSNTVLSTDANSVDIAQQLNVDANTASTSSSTGALVVDGGMGLAGDAHFGGDLSLQHDAAVLHLGADDDVSLTHVADTGLLLNSSRQLQFGDSATYIHQSADGQLDAVADVELALTAPIVDIDASTAVRISNDLELDSDAAVLKFGADSDVSLTHVADTGLLLNAGMALQFRDADLSLSSSADGQLDIDADTKVQLTTATAELVVTALDVNASGAITLDSASASNITVDSANLSLGTTTSGELDLTSAGLLDINGGAGVDIDATGALSLDGSTGINIGVAADVAIDVDSATFDLDASGAITIDGTSTISIGGAAAAGDISVGTNATARNITVGNVTGATALNLDAGSGGINLGNAADAPINIDASTFDMTSTDTTGFGMSANAAGNKTLTISATNAGAGEGRISVSAAHQVDITDGTGTLTLDGGVLSESGMSSITLSPSGAITLQSTAGAIDIDADNGKLSLDGSAGIDIGVESDVAIDVDASTFDLDASNQITLTSSLNQTSAIVVDASHGSGGIDLSVASAPVVSIEASSIDMLQPVVVKGVNPSLTIGDGDAEDALLKFNGNAQDFYVGLDDSADKLVVGLGSTAGTTANMSFNSADRDVVFHSDIFVEGGKVTLSNGSVIDSETAGTLQLTEDLIKVAGNLTVTGDLLISGDTTTINTATLEVEDESIVINKGAGANSAALTGIFINENDTITGYLRTAADRTNLEFKAPGGNILTLDVNADKTMTVAGSLNIENDSSINQDLTTDAAVTFASITSNGGIAVDNITIDGTEIDLSAGDLTLDVAGNIIMNADGGTVEIKDAAVSLLKIENSTSNVVLKPGTADKDILFKSDDDVLIATLDSTATSLLMATSKKIEFSDAGEHIYSDGTDLKLGSGGDIDLTATTNVNVPSNVGLTFGADTLKISSDGTNITQVSSGTMTIDSDSSMTLGASSFDIDADGGAGSGAISIDTNDTTNGLRLATGTAGVPITIGNANSETTISDNLTVSGTTALNGNVTLNNVNLFVEDGSDNVKFQVDNSGNVTVAGTLEVTNSITSNGTELTIVDTLIKIGSNADADSNNRDIGVYAPLSGNNENLGLIWDENESIFKLYESLNAPSGERFDFTTGVASKLELGSIELVKTASTSNQDTSSGNFTSNVASISHTLTLDGAFPNNNAASFTVTSDKVLSTSVVLGSSNKNLDVRIHTVQAGSFICEFTNKSGGEYATDSDIIFNFVVM